MKPKTDDVISVKDSMAIITEVWKKYKDYTPKWKAQRIVYICNRKYKKAITLAKEAEAREIFKDIENLFSKNEIEDEPKYVELKQKHTK